MIKRTNSAYWEAYSNYQKFTDIKTMIQMIKRFAKTYHLSDSVKSVLNTITLHSKNYIGVCWLYREEIARKANVSVSTVDRAIKELRLAGLLTVHNMVHTKRGGKTHNVYVINPVDNLIVDASNDASVDASVDASLDAQKEPVIPCGSRENEAVVNVHKNFNKNLYKNLNKKSIEYVDNNIRLPELDDRDKAIVLQHVPKEFQEMVCPYYSDPQIILNRWITVCVAIKKFGLTLHDNPYILHNAKNLYTSWDTIQKAWKIVVNRYKRKRIKNTSDDGIGGYFYAVLSDLFMHEQYEYGW